MSVYGHRDLEVLAMLAEHRVMVVPQVADLIGVSDRTAARLIGRLAAGGLASRERIFAGRPAAVWITRTGLGLLESRLPAPRVDLKGYRHDVGVGWLWLAARDGTFGAVASVVSERQMRSHDALLARGGRRAGPVSHGSDGRGAGGTYGVGAGGSYGVGAGGTYGVGVGGSYGVGAGGTYGVGAGGVGPTGLPQRHYPDLLLVGEDGSRTAIELELTGKSERRLAQIMRGYAGDPAIDCVLYLVPDARLSQRVAAAARRAGIADMVHVQRVSPEIEGVPAAPRGRTAARTQTCSQAREGLEL